MRTIYIALFSCIIFTNVSIANTNENALYIRINQMGYLKNDFKSAIIFSNSPVRERFTINNESSIIKYSLKPKKIKKPNWGTFKYYYELNFSHVKDEGIYTIQGHKSKTSSQWFQISNFSYSDASELLLEFMRQQRCGYNPLLDIVCHQKDGRSAYGPMPDETFVDASGGWHDAGDQLKYLITSSYATAHMLKAFELFPENFKDLTNALGQQHPNGIPDVLDEAKWGLDWIMKLHYSPSQLIHQVADDRDHRGYKMPDNDNADYGWGENSFRVAYFATGAPQGLRDYKSKATGFANLAGRSAAAFAIASKIWKNQLKNDNQAAIYKNYAISLYTLGKNNEGYQQGNSYGAPYRYNEETWADDMEWAAAELFDITGDKNYLDDAKSYAVQANSISWTDQDNAEHYQFYPFINIGHFALYKHVDPDFKSKLAGFYKKGINDIIERSKTNPYNIGIPFIWCSNNLMTSFITQIILYEQMTGDTQYNNVLTDHRDWLFGKNPWGTSMFTQMPENGEYPTDIHTSIYVLTKKSVPGGLVDGPIYFKTYNSLLGLHLTEEDEFAKFQNEFVVYHDDIGDYSTNEPTMDGTAGSILMMAYLASGQ